MWFCGIFLKKSNLHLLIRWDDLLYPSWVTLPREVVEVQLRNAIFFSYCKMICYGTCISDFTCSRFWIYYGYIKVWRMSLNDRRNSQNPLFSHQTRKIIIIPSYDYDFLLNLTAICQISMDSNDQSSKHKQKQGVFRRTSKRQHIRSISEVKILRHGVINHLKKENITSKTNKIGQRESWFPRVFRRFSRCESSMSEVFSEKGPRKTFIQNPRLIRND